MTRFKAPCCNKTSFLMLLTLAVSGCGGNAGYEQPETLLPVTGMVTLDGEPLTGATVSFVPDNQTTGTGGFAITDEAGKFSALHYSQVDGLQPGTYHVIFSKLTMENGQPIPADKDAADVGAVEFLPANLTTVSPDNHPYVLTVNSSPVEVSYELSSKGRKNRT